MDENTDLFNRWVIDYFVFQKVPYLHYLVPALDTHRSLAIVLVIECGEVAVPGRRRIFQPLDVIAARILVADYIQPRGRDIGLERECAAQAIQARVAAGQSQHVIDLQEFFGCYVPGLFRLFRGKCGKLLAERPVGGGAQGSWGVYEGAYGLMVIPHHLSRAPDEGAVPDQIELRRNQRYQELLHRTGEKQVLVPAHEEKERAPPQ